MLNEAQKFAIERFANIVYENNGNIKEAKFFLTHKQKLGIKAIDFQPDGQIIVITNENQTECLFHSMNNNDIPKKNK